VRDGGTTAYHENGNKALEATFSGGKLNGPMRRYYPNEVVAEISSYREGELSGEQKSFHKNGKLRQEGSFEAGKPTGTHTTYHPTGEKLSVTPFQNGEIHGVVQQFHQNGKLSLTGRYVKGKENGVWKRFNSKGKLIGKLRFKNGTGKFIQWLDDGKKVLEGRLKDGKRDGEWLSYDKDGNKVASETFEGGKVVERATYTGGNKQVQQVSCQDVAKAVARLKAFYIQEEVADPLMQQQFLDRLGEEAAMAAKACEQQNISNKIRTCIIAARTAEELAACDPAPGTQPGASKEGKKK
jgi:antitoxin component YwqK of YwqJK toxin-antitoxin module